MTDPTTPGVTGADRDEGYLARIAAALTLQVEHALASLADDHRTLAHVVLTLVVAAVGDPAVRPATHVGDDLLAAAAAPVAALAERVGPGGLFRGGDNVASPPDSAFSVNDLADALLLLRRSGAAPGWEKVLVGIVDGATPALLAGGVHTPNHRWEVCAALARLHRLDPRPELLARVEEWLAEGLDQDADGLWSERSANYAAYVSNPALLTLATVLGRADLAVAVERNLDATLGLLLPDGTVETVLSRRQDQRGAAPLRAFQPGLRAVALQTGRGDLAWAAGQALDQGLDDATAAAVAVTLQPWTAHRLPPPAPPPATRRVRFGEAHLVLDHRPGATLVTFAGSDYPRQRRIRSGLANSPTVLRLFCGAVVLDSVRLSRTFFGLGPFRPDGVQMRDDGSLALREIAEAAYYLPLPADRRDPGGRYRLEDEGRFSAAMSFAERARRAVALHTHLLVRSLPGGAELTLELDGPPVDWALELAFRSGGVLTGAEPLDVARWELPATRAGVVVRYAAGSDAVRVTVTQAGHGADGAGGPVAPADGPAGYEPGEDYGYLGGTDAVAGERLYVTGRAPARVVLEVVRDD